MARFTPRTILMLTLVLAVLPFGVAMASDDHGSTSNSGSPAGQNSGQGTTKTEPTKTEPTSTEPTKTDDTGSTLGSDDSGGPATTPTTDDAGGSDAGDDKGTDAGGDGASTLPSPNSATPWC